MIKKYKKGQSILLAGPSKAALLYGEVEIFGKVIKVKDKRERIDLLEPNKKDPNVIIISTGIRYPLLFLEDSEIDIYVANEDQVIELEDNSIPESWAKISNKIIEDIKKSTSTTPVKIMVLGLSSGKTTIIKYLANKLLAEGLKGGYLDSDLGQQQMYIPTTINIGMIDSHILSTQDFLSKDTKFIGSTFPKADLKYILPHYSKELIEEFCKKNKEIRFILIDTDGWIKTETGILYKKYFTSMIQPDYAIIFKNKEVKELEEIEKDIKKLSSKPKIFLIDAENKYYFERTKEDRRFLRQRQFAMVFEQFRKITVPFNEIILIKEEYDLENEKIIEKQLYLEELVKLPYHYVIIALKTEKNELINIALLFNINTEKQYFLLYSDFNYKEQIKIKKIVIGSLRLSVKGNYQGYLYL